MAERPVCRVIRSTEQLTASMLERPLTVTDALRLQRLMTHLAEARERLCPEIKGEKVLPEPLKSTFCSRIRSFLESAIREVERKGRIERPDEFTRIVYYVRRLQDEYKCGRG